ncbi:MAG: DegT/DnrJ/EryC1/StrS family aminotransferase [Caulobacteraceae bacterium]
MARTASKSIETADARFARAREELLGQPLGERGARPAPAAEPLYVTRPLLPPLAEFLPYLAAIWDSKWLTNGGQFHVELEKRLAEYLGVDHLALFTNGTIALVTALQALGVSGEVITTPYSFVATAHALVWNNIEPVFADIDPTTCNLDPARIEAAITPRTTAILPVHCYGGPCDVEAISQIAATHGLRVIYDAAHAFGVNLGGTSLLRHGDLAVLSFHATKVFHTFEGGAIVCPDAETKQRIDYLKNFGFANEVSVVDAGINGKMSEIQAAMGLLQLKHVGAAIRRRGAIDAVYREALAGVEGVTPLPVHPGYTPNYSYFPVLVDPSRPGGRDGLYERLRERGIHARRYFYPLISDMPMYRHLLSASPDNLPEARKIADRILCLPIYPYLAEEDVLRVAAATRG